jgi:hypothetical protein
MNIKKMLGVMFLILLTSACSHQQEKAVEKSSNPEYKITTLDSGAEMIIIPANKKSESIGFMTSVSGSSFSMRDRQSTDNYETICISRVINQKPKLMTCLVEKPADDNNYNLDSKTFTKIEISKAIERLAVKKGFKLASFEFNLDGKTKTEYTTRKFENYDQPEAYMIVRMLSNKDVWSGKPMLYIQEH